MYESGEINDEAKIETKSIGELNERMYVYTKETKKSATKGEDARGENEGEEEEEKIRNDA